MADAIRSVLDAVKGIAPPPMPRGVPPLDPESPEARHGVTDPMYVYGNPPGLTKPGNIDLRQLLPVQQPKTGNWGTVYSSNNELSNGKETVYPGIANGQFMEDPAARANAETTHRHLGEFSNPDDASRYAQKLHVDWELPGIMGLANRNTRAVGAPYPSTQYAPLGKITK